MVRTANKKESMGVVDKESRGTSHGSRSNKTSDETITEIKSHIESFPVVESHYCRKNTTKKYLNSNLTVTKMYSLYLEFCHEKSIKPADEQIYRHIFNTHYNIGFHKPLKDKCDFCTSYQNARSSDRIKLNEEYESHLRNKKKAREEKFHDKLRAKEDSEFVAACFDLEQVLPTPKCFESSVYYKRQLNNYNFTIYDLGTKDGYSYLWNESIASRGACEIASCIFDFICVKASAGVKKLVFFSDNCVSQNKNKYYLTMLWYCLRRFKLESICHKYLEKGHTFNENDVVHSTIENSSKNMQLYTTSQWATLIESSRRSHPYKVKLMSLPDFYNFKTVSELFLNFDKDSCQEKVVWNKIRKIKLTIENKTAFFFKYDYDGNWHRVDLMERKTRQSNRPDVSIPDHIQLSALRNDLTPITRLKYEDLVSLCIRDIIPRAHHIFYALLPHD
jgi:hypothetical protein